MKNENKIVELLAESLKKQDQMIDRQDKQEELLNVLTQGQAQLLLITKDLVINQKETNRRLASIEDKLTEVSELRKRIEEIERYVGMK